MVQACDSGTTGDNPAVRYIAFIIGSAFAIYAVIALVAVFSGVTIRLPEGLLAGAISYFVIRYGLSTPSRLCPTSGKPVEVGRLDCGSCGFDFRTIGQTQPPA
jgi:hypothetical protein